mmetsp:Transcript_29082/g.42893  ORF Transcript_29082/g.42893 Transcript_29082/m.42893 type:complete len:80 (-) Transcript_29082:280-519(-)
MVRCSELSTTAIHIRLKMPTVTSHDFFFYLLIDQTRIQETFWLLPALLGRPAGCENKWDIATSVLLVLHLLHLRLDRAV